MEEIKEYEAFIKKQELCDFQQSVKWAKVKTLWQNEIIILKDKQQNIIASMSILIRKIPFFGHIMYVPRGPIGNLYEEKVLKEITNQVKQMAKKYKAFVLIIEPNIKKEDETFQNLALSLGYKINSKAIKFEQEIQARHNFRLNLENKTEEEVFQNFSPKTRYNIRLAIKKGVIVEEKNETGIDEFYELMQETGKRDSFRIRTKEYFETILQEFPKEAKIFIAYYKKEPISAIMIMQYGNKMWYLYGASGNKNRNLMSTYLLQWEMIKLAIKEHCKIYDFRGVSMEKGENGGLYRFKKGFGGDFIELIGEIYIPFRPIFYFFYKIAKKIFCNLRYILYQIRIYYEK